jgi:hypothetical protein
VSYVAYHTHDFSWIFFEVKCDVLANWIFLQPVAVGKGIVDDRDLRASWPSRSAK